MAWGGTAAAQPGPGEPVPESDLPAFLPGPHKRGGGEVAVLKFASGTGSTRKGSLQGEHESFCSSGHFCPCPEVVDWVREGHLPEESWVQSQQPLGDGACILAHPQPFNLSASSRKQVQLPCWCGLKPTVLGTSTSAHLLIEASRGFTFFFFKKILAILVGVLDPRSATRDQTHAPCMEARSFSHWTAREVPPGLSFTLPLACFPHRLKSCVNRLPLATKAKDLLLEIVPESTTAAQTSPWG